MVAYKNLRKIQQSILYLTFALSKFIDTALATFLDIVFVTFSLTMVLAISLDTITSLPKTHHQQY